MNSFLVPLPAWCLALFGRRRYRGGRFDAYGDGGLALTLMFLLTALILHGGF